MRAFLVSLLCLLGACATAPAEGGPRPAEKDARAHNGTQIAAPPPIPPDFPVERSIPRICGPDPEADGPLIPPCDRSHEKSRHRPARPLGRSLSDASAVF